MKRFERLEQIRRMDPVADALEIYRLSIAFEFPWDYTRALYRTYAVPAIGRLLAETAELTGRTQKRYDDTVLLLDAIVEHGFVTDEGRTAIRRVNQMHRSYDDMRYVLSTFVVVPKRWIDTYGWRRLSRHEIVATAEYYRTLGRQMGIPGIPETYEEFETLLDSYEEAHFAWDEQTRRVSDATLDLMASWYPRPLAPLLRTTTLALLDEPLLRAFRYTPPGPAAPALVRRAVRTRGRLVRLLPPRTALRTAELGDQGLSERLPARRPRHPPGPGGGRLSGAAAGHLSHRHPRVRRGWRAARPVRPGSWHARW